MDWTVIKILAFLCAFTVSCAGQGQGGLVNVALGKNCSQSSYYNGNNNLYPAGNAANGNTGGVFGTDNCIHTDNSIASRDYSPWWEVDLGKIYPVYGITIYARTGQGFRLTNTQITVDGAECHSIGKMSPSDVYSFNCTSILYGQKVRISRTFTTADYSLNMCEFQVFGCLNSQYRGDQCNQPCDSRCKDAVCKQDTGACLRCEAGTYGNNCAKQCDPRCQGNICNPETGSCLLNVALNQAASMSSQDINSGPASNAANGNTDSDGNLHADNCIVTGSHDTAPWWQVDLGRKYPVHSITSSAMLRRQTDLFPSTIMVDGSRCYRYSSQLPTRTPTFSCDSAVYGQVIRINRDYKSQDFRLSLCEFQVWVCTSGFFGDTCDGRCSVNQCAYCDQRTGTDCYECNAGWYSTDCSVPCIATKCKDNQCDRQTGLCTQCNGNFGGDYCTDCAPGFYGQDCIQQCQSTNCLNNACNRTHGRCDTCSTGSFGNNCDQSCPSNCKDNQCALTSGRCLSCPVRYWGGSCDQACSTGCGGAGNCDQETGDCSSCVSRRWGSKCDKECPSGCGGFRQCDARTGHCLSCPAGSWGNFCNNTCVSDRCKDSICNMTTGLCVDCREPNFQLPYCECKDNYYYYSPYCYVCTARCFNNTPCNKTDGYCDKCPPGITGRSCDQGCPRGTYGQDCAEKCGQCGNGDTCNAVAGYCPTCELGWTEPLCQECRDGFYGPMCSLNCSENCESDACDRHTGHCTCKLGWKPPNCLEALELTGLNSCDNDAVAAIGSVAAVLFVAVVALVVVVILLRRRPARTIPVDSAVQPSAIEMNVRMSKTSDTYENASPAEAAAAIEVDLSNYERMEIYENKKDITNVYTELTVNKQ